MNLLPPSRLCRDELRLRAYSIFYHLDILDDGNILLDANNTITLRE